MRLVQLSTNRHLQRIASQGMVRALGYYTFTVGLERLGVQYLHCFHSCGHAASEMPPEFVRFATLRAMGDLSTRDREAISTHSGQDHLRQYEAAFSRGNICVVARMGDDELACECWISLHSDYFLAPGQNSWLVERCLTVPKYRGQGLYPLTLRFACQELQASGSPSKCIFIECSPFNSASLNGIRKAGFSLAGKRLSFRHWRRQWAVAHQN